MYYIRTILIEFLCVGQRKSLMRLLGRSTWGEWTWCFSEREKHRLHLAPPSAVLPLSVVRPTDDSTYSKHRSTFWRRLRVTIDLLRTVRSSTNFDCFSFLSSTKIPRTFYKSYSGGPVWASACECESDSVGKGRGKRGWIWVGDCTTKAPFF